MKTSSCKAKGRALQQLVRDKVLEAFPTLTDLDVRSTPMGSNGQDLMLSTAAKALFPYGVECKNVEGFAKVYNSFKQAEDNLLPGDTPLLVIKSNRKSPLAIMRLDDFMALILKGSHE